MPKCHLCATKVPIFSKNKLSYYNLFSWRKMFYEKGYFIYENDKINFHIIFLAFRIIWQILQKKCANMSLKHRGQSVNPPKMYIFWGGIRWIVYIWLKIKEHTNIYFLYKYVLFVYIDIPIIHSLYF